MDNNEILVPVENLHPNPDNPRYEAGDVTELAASIRENGLLQSLLVRPAPHLGEVRCDGMSDATTEVTEALSFIKNGLSCLVTDVHIHQEPDLREVADEVV